MSVKIKSTVIITGKHFGSYTIGISSKEIICFKSNTPVRVTIFHETPIGNNLDLIPPPTDKKRSFKSSGQVYPTDHNGYFFTGLAFPGGSVIPAENIQLAKSH